MSTITNQLLFRQSTIKTVGRLTALLLALASLFGPWFSDAHPATADTCLPPLVWLGDGHCACLISLVAFMAAVIQGQSSLWGLYGLCWLLALPLVCLTLLFLYRDQRILWIINLAAWGLTAILPLFDFFRIWCTHHELFLWGAGLYGLVAGLVVAGEILIARKKHRAAE